MPSCCTALVHNNLYLSPLRSKEMHCGKVTFVNSCGGDDFCSMKWFLCSKMVFKATKLMFYQKLLRLAIRLFSTSTVHSVPNPLDNPTPRRRRKQTDSESLNELHDIDEASIYAAPSLLSLHSVVDTVTSGQEDIILVNSNRACSHSLGQLVVAIWL